MNELPPNGNNISSHETEEVVARKYFDILLAASGREPDISDGLLANVKETVVHIVKRVLMFDDLETEIALHSADAAIPRKTGFGRPNTDLGRLGAKLTLLKMSHGAAVCKVDLAKAREFTAPYKLMKPDLAQKMFENYFAGNKLADDEILLVSGVTKTIVEKLLED